MEKQRVIVKKQDLHEYGDLLLSAGTHGPDQVQDPHPGQIALRSQHHHAQGLQDQGEVEVTHQDHPDQLVVCRRWRGGFVARMTQQVPGLHQVLHQRILQMPTGGLCRGVTPDRDQIQDQMGNLLRLCKKRLGTKEELLSNDSSKWSTSLTLS